MSTLHFQPRVPVFDANIGVGHRHDRAAPFENTNELLDEMGRHGVGRAVIYHVQGEKSYKNGSFKYFFLDIYLNISIRLLTN